jgi:hypothetical protein
MLNFQWTENWPALPTATKSVISQNIYNRVWKQLNENFVIKEDFTWMKCFSFSEECKQRITEKQITTLTLSEKNVKDLLLLLSEVHISNEDKHLIMTIASILNQRHTLENVVTLDDEFSKSFIGREETQNLEFQEIDLDSFFSDKYFEETKPKRSFISFRLTRNKKFIEKLQELNTKKKRGVTCYQCPYCLKYYAQNGMYGHIDANNEWKRKCKELKGKVSLNGSPSLIN